MRHCLSFQFNLGAPGPGRDHAGFRVEGFQVLRLECRDSNCDGPTRFAGLSAFGIQEHSRAPSSENPELVVLL